MMPLKCRGCVHYVSEYISKYHGVVEGCGCQSNIPYPKCYEKKLSKDATQSTVSR